MLTKKYINLLRKKERGKNMKKKIILSMFTLIAICFIYFAVNNNVKAATYYNDEIYYNEMWDGNIQVVAAGKYIENATIPSKINGKTVTEISDFTDCKYLKKVTIPNTVKNISSYTFSGCTSLTSINIPSSVTTIKNVFCGCNKLSNVVFEDSNSEWYYYYNGNTWNLGKMDDPTKNADTLKQFVYSKIYKK